MIQLDNENNHITCSTVRFCAIFDPLSGHKLSQFPSFHLVLLSFLLQTIFSYAISNNKRKDVHKQRIVDREVCPGDSKQYSSKNNNNCTFSFLRLFSSICCLSISWYSACFLKTKRKMLLDG